MQVARVPAGASSSSQRLSPAAGNESVFRRPSTSRQRQAPPTALHILEAGVGTSRTPSYQLSVPDKDSSAGLSPGSTEERKASVISISKSPG